MSVTYLFDEYRERNQNAKEAAECCNDHTALSWYQYIDSLTKSEVSICLKGGNLAYWQFKYCVNKLRSRS